MLIVVQNLPVPLDRRVWLEATTLTQHGYRVSVIAPAEGNQPWEEELDGVRVLRYPPPPEAHFALSYMFEFVYCWISAAILAIQLFARDRFHIIQACNPPETYFLLAAMFRPLGVRFVFDHHDLSPEMYLAKGGCPRDVLHRALLWLERRTFQRADLVIATNASHAKIAHERGGVDLSRIVVVRNGPDTERLREYPPDDSLKGGRRFLVAYLGEMCVQDGVDHLLHAAHELVVHRGRNDVGFVLIGGGPQLQLMKALARDLGISRYIQFTGRIRDELLCRYLSTAEVCVDPDPLTEWSTRSTMNKIMEYMFFGKPIVAYPLHENRQSAGDAALYVTPNDPTALADGIARLLDDPGERQRLGRFGYERVREDLMWQASVPRLLEAYAKATGPAH